MLLQKIYKAESWFTILINWYEDAMVKIMLTRSSITVVVGGGNGVKIKTVGAEVPILLLFAGYSK